MLLTPILLLATSLMGGPAPDGDAVVRAAHAKYAGKWPTSFTYLQKTLLPDGRLETWYTAVQLPGKMRVDVAPALTGRAMIYRSDSLYTYGARKTKTRSWWPNSFLTLLGDIHVAPPAETSKRLRKFGFNMAKTHESTWEGRPAIVVGALAGDLRSKQFWLDKERLVLVRLIEPNGADPKRPLDAHIVGYHKVGGIWMERGVKIHLGGQLAQLEEIHELKLNAKHEMAIFDPGPYRLPGWVGGLPDVWGKPQRVR